MRPDVGAVVGDEDRQVADQRDAQRRAVSFQREPVAREEELLEALLIDLATQRLAGAVQRLRIARAQLGLPFGPRPLAARALDRRVEREVLEPRRVRRTEHVV